ncbi:MAG: hypothetical protein KAX31_02940 [Thermoplasmata archaeon]|nr:hypothetical protein [Thermoplasmata archaeon]
MSYLADNVIDETVGKIFGKLGITGMAAAILTIIFGVIVILDIITIELIVGLYLIIVGIINLIGYIPAITAQK